MGGVQENFITWGAALYGQMKKKGRHEHRPWGRVNWKN